MIEFRMKNIDCKLGQAPKRSQYPERKGMKIRSGLSRGRRR